MLLLWELSATSGTKALCHFQILSSQSTYVVPATATSTESPGYVLL